MPTNLHVRDVPDRVHEVLRDRARRRGLSLRQYTLEVLTAHCETPTIDEWLDDLSALPAHRLSRSAAEAVAEAREEDDAEVARAAVGG
jgi:plasmid stability protein